MLTRLTVKDYVLIDSVELDLDRGFTVLTGETGAGKSIVLGAISLILGGRSDTGNIRAGSNRADIVAEFDVSSLPHVVTFLEESDLGVEDCVLRRVIDTSGRSRAWINGVPVTVKQLRDLGALLVDIHGQHEHYSLVDSSSHCQVLDRFGHLSDSVVHVEECWQYWRSVKAELSQCLAQADALEQKVEGFLETKNDLDALDFSPQEWPQTVDQHRKLSNLNELISAASESVQLLGDGDQNILSILADVRSKLDGVAEVDPQIGVMLKDLESLEIQLSEFNRDLRRYAESLDVDPSMVDLLDKRIADVQRCARKYGVSPDELFQLRASVELELEQLAVNTDAKELHQEEAVAQDRYLTAARKLSSDRTKVSAEMTQKVNAALMDLAMSGVRFDARVIPKSEPGLNGLEQVEFYVSTNPGAEAKPVGKVASGGELSRISLAIQSVIYQDSAVPTVIFDEVDSGVGGAVAEIVGRMLKAVGERAQVLCVTHLPQVAALADSHWRVSKVQSESVSSTLLLRLQPKECVDEVARMLAGEVISEQARAHARELIKLGAR
ncbi:MAG: DNA repair protein RecN [Burkholderiales bacterium]|jgi:DNA repair protein RecN (Recombination protein N)|tara:strand:+ start:6864 stop:8522 length:1659 start_codon:yes stop_codon:yes gene_type:complete